MTTPEQQARELLDTKPDHLAQLLHFVKWERANNPPASGQKHIADWAYGEITRLRAGIEAALGEIEKEESDESAKKGRSAWQEECVYHGAIADGLSQAAAIVRKHTGVTP